MPNVSVISEALYVDDTHVALSYQFFNKTRENILVNPNAALQVTNPNNGARHYLTARYLRTETSGPIFEAMKAKLAGIASYTGMSKVFRLRGADIYEVTQIESLTPVEPRHSRGLVLLMGLRRALSQLRRSDDLKSLLDALLGVLTEHCGFQYCTVLYADENRNRLYTVASVGYPESGIGSEIGMGEGLIGVAARERTPIRITHLAQDYLYGAVVRAQFRAANPDLDLEREIAFPGLADSGSQMALPLIGNDRLLGVLYIESPHGGRLTPSDEQACAILIDEFVDNYLRLAALDETDAEDPISSHAEVTNLGPRLVVSHEPTDHSIFVNNEYLIKGVAGAILWRILSDYIESRRVVFTNRELRRDPRLGLPEITDNLEARLVLLQHRLAERRPELSLRKAGRGRYELTVTCPIVFGDTVSG
jgi:adenylate cyclase